MPKVIDHERYRDELLHRYLDIFARRGYLDVTMREIARELGVSTGTLYHYFPTKKDLLEQLFHLASRRDSSAVLPRSVPMPPSKSVSTLSSSMSRPKSLTGRISSC